MKRSTKQLLSLLLAIVMVCGLMAPAMAARPMMSGDVAETPVGDTAPVADRPSSSGKNTAAKLSGTPETFKVAADTDVTGSTVATGVSAVTLTLLTGGGYSVGADSNALDAGTYGSYPNYIKGANNPKTGTTTTPAGDLPDNGTAYQFSVTEAGALTVVYRIDNKQLCVLDTASDGNTTSYHLTGAAVTRKPGTFGIQAEVGHTYTLYAQGSKLGLAGFVFEAGGTVDTTPVITVSSPKAGDTTLSVETTVGATKSIAVTADVSNIAVTELKYTWYQAAGDTAAPATDTKVQDPDTTNSSSFAIDTTGVKAATKYYCVVSAAGAASVTSEIFTVTVKEAEPEPPEEPRKPGGTYTLDIKAEEGLTAGLAGETTKAGTKDYFTIGWNGDGNNTIDDFPSASEDITWTDDYVSHKRLKLDKMDRTTTLGQAFLGFKPLADVEVEVWWAGQDAKPLILTSEPKNETPVVGTNGVVWFGDSKDTTKKAPQYSKFTIPYDETVTDGYKFVVKGGQVSIYKVVITEIAPDASYTLDVKTENGLTAGLAGETTKTGTENYFTIGWNGDGNNTIDDFPSASEDITWTDNYTSHKRLKLDKMDRTTPLGQAFLGFKPNRHAIVEVWWAGQDAKPLILTSEPKNETPVVGTNGVVWFGDSKDTTKKAPQYSKFTIPYDETVADGYKFVVKGGQVSIYKVVVTETSSLEKSLEDLIKEISTADMGLTSANAGTEANAKKALETKITNIVNDKDVTITVTPTAGSFKAAVDGTFAAQSGTDGEIKFTVKLVKGEEEKTTAELTAAITAKAFVPVTNITVTGAGSATSVEKGKALQLTAAITPKDATVTDVTWSVAEAGAQYVQMLEGGRAYGKAVTPDGTKVTVTATATDGSDVTGTIELTVTPATVDPNATYINDGKSHSLSSGDFSYDGTTDWGKLTADEYQLIKDAGFEAYETKPGTTPSDTGGVLAKREKTSASVIQLPKDAGAGIMFKVGPDGGRVNLQVKAASTGGSNNSPLFLIKDPEGLATKVREDDGTKTVYGTSASTLNWTGLDEGTYLICSDQNATLIAPNGGNCGRGTRFHSAKVTPTGPDDKVPTPVLQTYETCTDAAKVNYNLPDAVGDVITVNDATMTVDITGLLVGTLDKADEETSPYDEFYQFADSVKIALYDEAGKEVDDVNASTGADNVTLDADGKFVAGKLSLTLTPKASGTYTIKTIVTLDGVEKVLDTSAAFKYNLPLDTPRTTSTTSEAGRVVTLKWNAITEATDYEVRYGVRAEDGTEPDAGSSDMVVDTTPATPAADSNFSKDSDGNYVWTTTMADTYEGKVATFYVVAIRKNATGADATTISIANNLKIQTADQRQWETKVFGTSASNLYNWKEGDINADGTVKLFSREGSGKITEPNGSDGLLFYYTTVPAGNNFKLKAKVHVSRWFTRDTQNGLGLAVLDRVPAESQTGSVTSTSGDYWNNGYMAGAVRGSFTYDSTNGKYYGTGNAMSATTSGDKSYSYYMGLFSVLKHGNEADREASKGQADTTMYDRLPLDTRLARDGISVRYNNTNNRFNTIGNYTKLPAGYSVQAERESGATNKFMAKYELTDFVLQLEKTPSGYVTTAWTADESILLGQVTQYYTKGAPELSACADNTDNPYIHYAGANGAEKAVDLSGNKDKGIKIMDPTAEYVGFFTSRDTDAEFTLMDFEMTPQAEDKTEVTLPETTYVTPSVKFTSGTSSNTEDFVLNFTSNVKGTLDIYKGSTLIESVAMDTAGIDGVLRGELPVTLSVGTNTYTAKLTVADEQDLPPFTEINPNPQPADLEATTAVSYRTYYQNRENLYVSPNGSTSARGSRVSPLDIHTAVSVVAPGQNIVMMAGEYKLSKTIDITPAMDGTEDAKIYMVPDVDENGEPVKVILNGQGKAGTVIKTGADWWVFDNFEVVNSSSGSKGFVVGGSHNVVQNVSVHDNGSSGLCVTRYSGNVKVPDRDKVTDTNPRDWGEWPCDNLILNCTSYRNYDQGYNGADGFEAKEAVGSGNVFDGCIAFWNADDGWDLYAKGDADKGCLGVVTIRNSITFQNGYEVRKILDSQTQTPELVEGSDYLPVMNTDENGKLKLDDAGNGNGFKMGGSHMPGAHVISNSYAFMNKAKGFDSNNGPDISVIDCTAYNNGDENVGLSSNATLAYVVNNVISFKDDNCPIGNEKTPLMADDVKEGKGNKIEDFCSWDGKQVEVGGRRYKSNAGLKLFESLTFVPEDWWDGALRDADGSLALPEGFLQLKAGVADGAGAGDLVNDATPEETPDAVTDPAEEPANNNGGGGGGGNGGTVGADTNEPKPDETTPVYVANKTTNAAGDTTIVVKDDKTGETVAEVKIPATIPTPETKFVDVPDDHWAAEAINNMAGMEIVNGIGNDAFGTNSELTRAQLATMLYRFANGKAGIDNTFADVADGQWYTDAIGWAVKVGVVTGYSADAFGPNDVITREQLAVMLARFAKLVGLDTEATSALADFADRNAVSNWATDGMNWCVKNGIINGVSEGTLSPKTSATRAQTALMLDRFIGLMK